MVRSDWYTRWADVERYNKKPFPGIALDALKFLHLQRKILFHGHEPLDTDTTPNNNYINLRGGNNEHR